MWNPWMKSRQSFSMFALLNCFLFFLSWNCRMGITWNLLGLEFYGFLLCTRDHPSQLNLCPCHAVHVSVFFISFWKKKIIKIYFSFSKIIKVSWKNLLVNLLNRIGYYTDILNTYIRLWDEFKSNHLSNAGWVNYN